MGDKGTSDTADSQSDADTQVDTDEGDAGDSAAPGDGDSDTAGAVAVACDALEGLTRAVEQLQAGGGRGKVVGDVVQELRAAADLLQEQLGGEATVDPAPTPTRADGLITAVSELVSELRASRKAAQPSADDGEEDDESSGKPKGKAKKADGSESPDTALGPVHDALKKINTHMEQQTRRLDRLEKRAGVPSSQPAGERPGRAPVPVADDVSWPLDLNIPRSR